MVTRLALLGLAAFIAPAFAQPALLTNAQVRTLPAGTLTLSFSWYLAHLNNSSSSDYFRVRVVSGSTATTVFSQAGAATNRGAAWQTATVNLSAYAGQTVQLSVEAADLSTASLVEAAVDNLVITRA